VSRQYHIATVVLNYNSASDVEVLLPQLLAQVGVKHTVIIVDNESSVVDVHRLADCFSRNCVEGIVGTPAEVDVKITSQIQDSGAYLVLSNENRGYSAGNNIGIRVAEALEADAVLIANPDIRIEDSNYLMGLSQELFTDEKNCIVASRVVGLDGQDQSPLREPEFWEEFLWPRFSLGRHLSRPVSYILPILEREPMVVPKVSGCCLMLSLKFLKTVGKLDENVFLYCEEPILSAQVYKQHGHIIFVPELTVTHAHQKSKKGHASRNMLLFIKSRKYYLKHYSSYGVVKRSALYTSYSTLRLLHFIKLLWNKAVC